MITLFLDYLIEKEAVLALMEVIADLATLLLHSQSLMKPNSSWRKSTAYSAET